MCIRPAATAIAALVVAASSSMTWAASDSSVLTRAGWQPLAGSDTAATDAGSTSAPDVTSGATLPAAPINAAVSATKPADTWTIREGFPIGEEIKDWAKRAGWRVVWQMPRDVIAAAATSFTGDFPSAVTDVVKTLAANGALIRAKIFDGNRTVLIQGPGVAPQQ
ncbi:MULTISPECIES: toxin co-regulated pilus biosynthesis Q family protein [Pandoraea]|uniref:Type IV pilus assembly protein n=2 Tax=Pandoraea TaxID=93217 RepID=A0A5E4XKX9_9BURK|nr:MULTISPECIES: toxin co-regulated pilus biosynthesis Q family protein [Pandoraea]VVE13983.1 type IV pilus assembly protein [Pandoraea cepalis]VVE36933.1 type IV pilus assembly protein [Pandoraea terrigena]